MVSGKVLNYLNDVPVSGVNVIILGTVTSGALASGITSSSGTWNCPTVSGTDSLIIYYPSLSGYVGYTRTLERYLDNIDLYVKPKAYITPTESIDFFDTPLKTSWTVSGLITTPCDAFIITDNGLDIIDSNSITSRSYLKISGGLLDVGVCREICGDQTVYLSVPNSGIYLYDFTSESPAAISASSLVTFRQVPNILSNNINKVSKNYSNDLALGSISGVDFITGDTQIRSYTQYGSAIGNTSLKLNNEGDVYYSPTGSGLYVKYTPSGNWTSPDYFINNTSTPSISGNTINDLEVIPTSSSYLIIMATNSGISVMDENRSNISLSSVKTFQLETISGSSLDIASIEVTTGSTFTSGTLFFSTYDLNTFSGVIQQLDLQTNTITSTFTSGGVDLRLKRVGLAVSGAKNIGIR
jgi:hypothetical protein